MYLFPASFRFPARSVQFPPGREHPVRVAGFVNLYRGKYRVQCRSES